MSELTPPPAAAKEALREAYAALNRNDVSAMVRVFDPQIEWIEPAGYSEGTYRGHAEVEAHLSRARETWAEGGCAPERFVVAGDKIVVFVYVRVRLTHHAEWVEGRHASVYTFRNGKAIQMRLFDDRREALEWAGVEASEADRPTVPS